MAGGQLNVLVTGASGLVGAEVVARLARAGYAVIALVHRASDLVRNNRRRISTVPAGDLAAGRVACVAGDVSRPGLGLSADVWERLRDRTHLIVHGAAITSFGRRAELYQQVNVDGTAHVLQLAQAGRYGPIPLIHISTAYVCGTRDGCVREDELDMGQGFGNDYERSKLRAESMVRQEMAAGLPAAIVRPSIVVGTERSGLIREFRNIYAVIKVYTRGLVRTTPGYYDAMLDLVPIDYVANLIAEVAERHDEAAGRTFHAIGATPLTLRELSDVLAEYPAFQVPRFVPPETWQRDRLSHTEREHYDRTISLYQSYALRRAYFTDQAASEFASRRPTTQAPTHLRRLLNHCLRAGYLGTPVPRTGSTDMAYMASNSASNSSERLGLAR